jgi:RNA polymerase sigma-70 factor (ECF subfamily)
MMARWRGRSRRLRGRSYWRCASGPNPNATSCSGALIDRYWIPAYEYVRSQRNVSVDDAKDLTQQFFAMVLERRDLERVSPERGSFRAYVKTAVRNFLASVDRAASARPRLLPIEEGEAAWQRLQHLPQEEIFDAAWARLVIARAVDLLRDEIAPTRFAVFEAYALSDDPQITYREVAARFGISEDDVRNELRFARRSLRAIVRRVVLEYVGPDGDVEAEIALVLSR